jgi:hypothetical protein
MAGIGQTSARVVEVRIRAGKSAKIAQMSGQEASGLIFGSQQALTS